MSNSVLSNDTRFQSLLDLCSDIQSGVRRGIIVPEVDIDQIRSHLQTTYDFSKPQDLETLSADVERMLKQWNVQITHPRYLGLFNPNVLPESVLADALVATYNPQLATQRTSPAAVEIERHTLAFFATKFGFQNPYSASFTNGGAEANLSAVIVALTRHFPRYGTEGLRGIPAQPAIYLTEATHHSFHKVAHMTGLGRNALRFVGTDEHLRMDCEDLKRRVIADRMMGFRPFMVVATAGTTMNGSIDPLQELAAFCRFHGLWLHVDAAWGGAAVLSSSIRSHLDGISDADSITCDAHKWLSVPMGAGMFFCRHPDSVRDAFRAETTYMPKTLGEEPDPYVSSIQWSRRFIGLKVFLPLARLGEHGYAEMIESHVQIGNFMRDCLQDNGWKILNDTPLPLICFTRDDLNPSRFIAETYRNQIAWISETHLKGNLPCLRACITNYQTSEADIHDVVNSLTQLWSRELAATSCQGN